MVLKRFTVAMVNVLFPPLAVYLLCGVGHDLMVNSALFLLAVIPSHVHGFYLSWTYFNRKRKIRKGLYPGSRRPMIDSDKVQNGGASNREVMRLKKDKVEKKNTIKPTDGSNKQDPGRIRRLFRRSTKSIMPPELASDYGYSDGDEKLAARRRSVRRRNTHHGTTRAEKRTSRTRDEASGRSKGFYDDSFQPILVTDSEQDVDNHPIAARQQTMLELNPDRRHSVQDTATSRRKSLRRRSTSTRHRRSSRQLEEHQPPLPNRTYRSDIDGWLVRLETEQRTQETS